jgi:glutamine amidotransferase
MRNLRDTDLIRPLLAAIEGAKPFLGICLGMQLLFEESEEIGVHRGLGVLPGRVVLLPFAAANQRGGAIRGSSLKVPHIGWNQIRIQRSHSLLDGVTDGSFAYFVHSYYVEPSRSSVTVACTDYGLDFASIVSQDNVVGIQFHPEKSQRVGLRMLANFASQYTDLGHQEHL